MMKTMSSVAVLAISLAAAPVQAQQQDQDAPPQTDLRDEKGQIVVIATRMKGQVDTAEPPVATYDEKDISALGAGSINELLSRVSAQTGSGRGRGGQHVILVNGQRITDFREMRNFPPEAIKRMEVLPEEVALRYGYPPDARVINFILKDNFRSRSVEARYSVPTRGGFSSWQLEGTLLKIQGPRRFSVTGTADDTSPLFESERGIQQSVVPAPGSPNPGDYRTLIADSRNFGLNASWSTGLGKDGKGGQLSLNGNATRADSRSGSGLDALTAPLERVGHVTTLFAGAGLNTNLGQWQLSVTADATHGENATRIDRFAGTGFDTALSNTDRFTSMATLMGRPLHLPAGDVSATVKAGYVWANIQSSDTRALAAAADLTRSTPSAGLTLAVPLTSRREGVLEALGDLTLNLSASYDHVSDFGAVTDWSAGLTWSPTDKLGLSASYIVNAVAPTLSQLGNPQTVTFNVPVYDFVSGQTVLATVTGGGNPLLRKEQQRDLKLSANWQLPVLTGSSVLVEYFRNNSSDVTASFPVLTPAIEAAFPGRVTRDLSGRITAVDQRPVTLAEQKGSRLRWGLNLTGTIGKAPEGGGGGMMGGMMGGGPPRGGGARPAGTGGGSRGGGGGFMGAMMGGQGRWSLGLFHTVQLSSTVLVAPGGPVLDLLDGDALSGGGTPRHTLEFNGGAFHKGFGLFLQGSWNGATTLRSSGTPGASDLHFGALGKINLNLFADLGRMPKLTKKAKFFKGSRLALQFENLFDARQSVTDASGTVPLSYQPDYLDPRGRVITVNFRKLF